MAISIASISDISPYSRIANKGVIEKNIINVKKISFLFIVNRKYYTLKEDNFYIFKGTFKIILRLF